MAPIDWMDLAPFAGGGSGGGAPEGARPPGTGAGEGAERDPWDVDPAPSLEERTRALLEGLNEPQREAVQHGAGPMLILAGAGSGKTRVITRRVAYLVESGLASPHEVLAITFTNKAAKEMRERVTELVPARGLWISTFHSMCARILRSEIEVLGTYTRDFTIYDTYDKNQLLKNLIKDAGWDLTQYKPALVGSWLSSWKNSGLPSGLDFGEESAVVEDPVLMDIRPRYLEAMRANNALDFDDLQLLVLEIFEKHHGVRDLYAHRFRFCMVDEYQDTNRIQYRLVRHLSSMHGNLAVCGDPDQSIYAWRGADIRNILDFEGDWPGAKVVKLEQNYRSKANILKAAQGVIANNASRKEKDLWTEQEPGPLLSAIACSDEYDESDEIARQIRSWCASGGKLGDVAIFYRVSFLTRALERGLSLDGLPYQIVGGTGFYQRREIRDLLAYLRLLVNPADDVSFRRAVNVPARGVGATSLEKLSQWAGARRVSLTEAAASAEARATIRGRGRKGLETFSEFLAQLRDLDQSSAGDVLERILLETDYEEYLSTSSESDGDAEARLENVQELCSNARAYDAQVAGNLQAAAGDGGSGAVPDPAPGATGAATGGLRGFLEDVALVSEVDDYDESVERITLMTLHAAKGLEFPLVILAGMEDELIPHARALMESVGDRGLEEERRLMYVGMTRAQQRLIMTHAKSRQTFQRDGGMSYQPERQRSRFVEEIPPELLEGGASVEEEDDVLGAFAPKADAATSALSVGDWVKHDHFGTGLVERLTGSGINARATVSFTSAGTKHLLLQYANLRVVER